MKVVRKFKSILIEESSSKLLLLVAISVVFFITSGLLVLGFYWLYSITTFHNYSNAINWISDLFHGGYLVKDLKSNLTSHSHFNWLKSYSTFLFFLISVLFCSSSAGCFYLFRRLKNSTFVIPKRTIPYQWILPFIGLWIMVKIFIYKYLPLHIDEVFDFIYFSKQSFLLRQSYIFNNGHAWFNNHLLYTHFSALLHLIGFSDKLAIRLPSILSEFLLFWYLITVIKKDRLLLFFLVGLLSSFWLGLYSVEGRSYYLVALFFIVLLLESYRFYLTPSIRSLIYFILVSILGLAASKLFIIPLSGVMLIHSFILFQKRILVIESLVSFLLLLIGGISIYFPAFILGGSATFYVDMGKSGNLIALFPLLLQNFSVITGLNTKSYWGILFILLLFSLLFKRLSLLSKFLGFQLLVQLIVLSIFVLASQEYLPFRAVIYLSALFTLTLLSVLYDLIQSFNTKWIYSSLIICVLFISNTIYLYHYSWLKKCTHFILDKSFYYSLETNINLISEESIRSVFVEPENNYYFFYLKFYLGDQVTVTEDFSLSDSSDIIITSTISTEHSLLFYDDLNEVFIYKNNSL